jgi:hypothetical protein
MIRETSSMANRNRDANTRADQRRAVAAKLKQCGPLTREALEFFTGIEGNTLRPVILECIKAKTIRRLKGCGTTKAGNKAELLGAVR